MNNKEFIGAIALKTGYTQDESQQMVKDVIEQLSKYFESGESVAVSGFGTFEVKKRLERVMVNPATGLRMLVPPKLVLNFKPATMIKVQVKKGGWRMAKSVIQIIATAIAKKHNISIAHASSFVEAFFTVIGDELKRGNQVKVKGLGTFKVQTVKPRESVNVNTGERVLIKGHDKISFTPDASMKELVNKPFSQFETVVINDNVNVEELETLPEEELSETVEQADQDFEDTISKPSVVDNRFTAAMDNSIDEDNDSPNTFNTQSVNGGKRTQENNTSQKEVVETDSSIYAKSQETLYSTKDKYVDTPNVTTSGEALNDIDDTDDDIESSSNSILRVVAFLAAIIIVFLGVFLWMKVGNGKGKIIKWS